MISTAHAAVVKKAPVRYHRETGGISMYLNNTTDESKDRRRNLYGTSRYLPWHDIDSSSCIPCSAHSSSSGKVHIIQYDWIASCMQYIDSSMRAVKTHLSISSYSSFQYCTFSFSSITSSFTTRLKRWELYVMANNKWCSQTFQDFLQTCFLRRDRVTALICRVPRVLNSVFLSASVWPTSIPTFFRKASTCKTILLTSILCVAITGTGVLIG